MKALEKAAKDRDDARAEPDAVTAEAAPVAAAPRSELTLEPLRIEPQPAAPVQEPPARPAAASRGAAARTPSREQAQAASVLEAGSGARTSSAPPTRVKPLLVFGAVAGLIAIGFGTYVYLQVFHPSLFYKTPPIALKPPPAPVPAAGAPAAAPATGSVPAPAAADPAPPAVAAAPVLKDGAPSAGPAAPAPGTAPSPAPAPESAPARAQPKPESQPAPAAALAAPAPAPRSPIVVTRSTETPTVHPLLNEGYSALQSEQLAPARGAYDRLLRADPRNTDALLGLAAVDMLEGRNEEAIRRYLQVLDLEPRNATAQSGLIGLLGRADPLAAESRLKQLIAREPSAFLYFTLGNLYADQSRWALAQQAYFQAHHLDPSNADYAYNLAIGLEHLSQPKLALSFYRRAVQLAGGSGRAHFNLPLAQDRISKLASQVE